MNVIAIYSIPNYYMYYSVDFINFFFFTKKVATILI